MHGARTLFAALLFVAFTLGALLHGDVANGMAGFDAQTVLPAHVAEGGAGCCRDHHGMTGSDTVCQSACDAVAVLGAPSHVDAPLPGAVQFASRPPVSGHGVTPALDPFPPRPFTTA